VGFSVHILRCIFGLACMFGVWSSNVEINFVSSLHGRVLVNRSQDIFCVLAGIRVVCSTNFEMNFVSSLAWDRFV
jgi:hypothetical protein